MNPYLQNLSKMEFVLTNACSGRCKHCSEGDHSTVGGHIDHAVATRAMERVASEYDIQTVMVFGGEPLLYADAVYEIMRVASRLRIPKRQLITNGFFSKNPKRISEVAQGLYACGVNDLLLSVDAFHQESIPLEVVRVFAQEVKRCGIPIRLQPAWLVSIEDENPYNCKTRELLAELSDLAIPVGEGNIVFPEGNAIRYLSEYFQDTAPPNPYRENPYDVRTLSFAPDGEVLSGNACETDIMEILNDYRPEGNKV